MAAASAAPPAPTGWLVLSLSGSARVIKNALWATLNPSHHKAEVNSEHNDAEDDTGNLSPLTVSLRHTLDICSRRKHRGVSGESGGGPRKGAEDFQISSHIFRARITLRFRLGETRSKEGAKRCCALSNIVSGCRRTALLPLPGGRRWALRQRHTDPEEGPTRSSG